MEATTEHLEDLKKRRGGHAFNACKSLLEGREIDALSHARYAVETDDQIEELVSAMRAEMSFGEDRP
ncbi:hypothetical protein [Aeromicrobium piscarium]|uniref:Uncharacterized protein n=1 Tax=Aeromicrobium piscarium TaxID=2590901 RepID=A0A554SP22_9ACTN|nr:hypothetical protein [Aeromicrobium piscarium]TSD68097.1 hypothetical protein FNM00_00435 [Aeromicrobium piscarium]